MKFCSGFDPIINQEYNSLKSTARTHVRITHFQVGPGKFEDWRFVAAITSEFDRRALEAYTSYEETGGLPCFVVSTEALSRYAMLTMLQAKTTVNLFNPKFSLWVQPGADTRDTIAFCKYSDTLVYRIHLKKVIVSITGDKKP